MFNVMAVWLLLLSCVALPSGVFAAALKTHVTEFNVVGVHNRDEMKATLQGMLASRLNPDQAQLVENPGQAELVITGSYAQFGKMFSIDLLLKQKAVDSVTKVFEQGEGEGDIIPAINRLARKIEPALAKMIFSAVPSAPAPTVAVPLPVTPPAVLATPAPPVIRPVPAVPPASTTGFVVKSEIPAVAADGSWSSEPLTGIYTGMALGRTFPGGGQEIFICDEHTVRSYLKGTELKLLAEIAIPMPARILGIDSADLDGDKVPELYVSIIDREKPSSRVYAADGVRLEKIAADLPWFFRGIGNAYGNRSIYGQELGTKGEFYGNPALIRKIGNRFEAGNQVTLPRNANLFTFGLIKNTAGKNLVTAINEDGYLTVNDMNGEEIWKSTEKYGGSEANFKRKDYSRIGSTGDQYRWTFLEQRIVTLSDGMVLLPRNEGMFTLGNSRSYDRHTLYALRWSGSVFKEAWRTRIEPGYLADFAYDPATRSVVMLEVVQKAGLTGKGKSVLSVNRVE